MSATKEQYQNLFEALEGLEENKREISGDIKERIVAFGENYGLNPKAVKRAYSLWKELNKDEGEFHEVDGDTDTIINAFMAGE